MNRPKVYLGGIISGLSFKDANEWREIAQKKLEMYGIQAASPLRGKDHLADETVLHKMGYEKKVMSSQKGITTRDRWDVMSSDLIIMNLLGAKSPSIGCSMEIAWADLLRKPIVAIMEPGNVHEHCMLLECVNFRVHTVDEAIEITRKILVYSL